MATPTLVPKIEHYILLPDGTALSTNTADSTNSTNYPSFFANKWAADLTITTTVVPLPRSEPVRTPSLEVFPEVLDLDVIASDIAKGEPGSPHGCAVALAVARRFDGALSIGVNGAAVLVTVPEGYVQYESRDGELGRFVQRFDAHGHVTPTRLRLVRSN